MEKAKVFFTDMRALPGENLLGKLEKLIRTAGIEKLTFEKTYTAIKIHFGEPGNLAYLRPNYAKVLADVIKSCGGKVFLTDCNTLYVGRRKNAIDHMDAAYENGFNPFATGCHVIIADGVKGTDEVAVPIDGEYVKEAKIGRAVMDADIVISLTHFKAHEGTGIGGAIKNIGMGCGSRAGKMEMHSDGKPEVTQEDCVGCGICVANCAHGAIKMAKRKASIDQVKCVGCGRCIGVCPQDAVEASWDAANDVLCKKMAEYAYAVMKGRPGFHVSLVVDVSPYCDCHAENDSPIIPDVGMFASFDPVALDQACTDMANREKALPHSMMDERAHDGDHFHALHPTTNWEVCLAHAEKMGLGTRAYDLIRI